jgi:hypothetical protein
MLMAGVLMPAAAYAEPGDRGDRSRSERSDRSDKSDNRSSDRPQRAHVERSSNHELRGRSERAERPVRADRNVDVQTSEPVPVRHVEQQQVTQPTQQVRRTGRRYGGFLGAVEQEARNEAVRREDGTQVRRDRDGDHRWGGTRDGDRRWDGNRDGNRRWSGDWRRDNRYDWRTYRNRYSSLYRLGRYYDPYGYSYRRFSIGFSLWPSYYGSNNWLNDPWQYRLPPAYGPYRWVRYYDDALLVNIYTGQVVDVIYSFFW